MSFRKRLTLFSSAGIAVVLVAGSGGVYLIERAQLGGEIDSTLRMVSEGVSISSVDFSGARSPGHGAVMFQLNAPQSSFGALPSYVAVVDRRGRQLVSGPATEKLPIPKRAVEIARSGRGEYYTSARIRGVHLRLRVSAMSGGRALIVAQSLDQVDRTLGRLAWGLAITDAVGIVLAALVGALVARGALRPVRRLTETAERVAATRDLAERIESGSEDELGRLIGTFNSMLDSLENSMRLQRQLVADASHELRTPLSSLRTNIDVLCQSGQVADPDRVRLLRDVRDELDELTALVGNLIDLARGSHRELHLQPVRLDEIVEAIVTRARARYPQIQFMFGATPTTVLGERQELGRAIWNLVENAAKWSASPSTVEVDVRNGVVSVRDHGPGIDAADRPYVFDRFYRADAARSQPGSGLGLAIVRQIAESHGGQVRAEEPAGGGAELRLTLVTV